MYVYHSDESNQLPSNYKFKKYFEVCLFKVNKKLMDIHVIFAAFFSICFTENLWSIAVFPHWNPFYQQYFLRRVRDFSRLFSTALYSIYTTPRSLHSSRRWVCHFFLYIRQITLLRSSFGIVLSDQIVFISPWNLAAIPAHLLSVQVHSWFFEYRYWGSCL